MAITYKKAGVDIKKGEAFARNVRRLSKTVLDTFGAGFPLYRFGFKRPVLVGSTDGVGTKLKVAFLCNRHSTVGIDLVAMNVNDIICVGATPLFFYDYIATGKIDLKTLNNVARGIVKGCQEAQIALLGGETAEMPDFYAAGEYDLAGFAVGAVEEKAMLPLTKKIREGDVIIGLASSGLHSNGYSFVRRVFKEEEMKARWKVFLAPTRIYVKPVLGALNEFGGKIRQIAHITGGGFYLKAPKGITDGLGLAIDPSEWDIPNIFKEIQERAGCGAREMFSTFNMGIGLTMVVEKRSARAIADYISQAYGIRTFVIGRVVNSRRQRVEIEGVKKL